jgi:putative drug exporter of the RND superfamily
MKKGSGKMDMWKRTGLFVHRFRLTFIVVLLACAISLTVFALKLPSILHGDGFRTDGDQEIAKEILAKDFKQSSNALVVVFDKEQGTTKEEFHAEIQKVVGEIEKEDHIDALSHPFNSQDKLKEDIAYATVVFEGEGSEEQTKRALALADKLKDTSSDGVTVIPTGFPIINNEVNAMSQEDLKKAELIGIPIAFLVLLFSFGSLLASILPIINGALSVISTMGILYFIGDYMPLSIFVLNVTPMIGLALSIDFALLFVNRFREEAKHMSVKEAIAATYQTAGRAIMFSGLCVFVGLSGLFFFKIDFIQSIAVSGMMVVIFSLLFSLTILPAMLAMFGERITKEGFIAKLLKRNGNGDGFWRKFGMFVMRNPIKMTVLVLVFIAISLLPIRQADLQFPGVETLPSSSESRIAYERYEEAFNADVKNYVNATIVVETAGPVENNLGVVEKLIRDIEQDEHVTSVTSFYTYMDGMDSKALEMMLQTEQRAKLKPVLDTFVKGNRTYVHVVLKDAPKSAEAKEWVRSFNEMYKREDATFFVGGMTKFTQELEDEIIEEVPIAAAVILGSTFIILMLAFRSLLIPFKAIIMNILSLSATIGIVFWLFNGGNFGLEQGAVMFTLPVFIFGLVFGLSMDYEVFLISRMQELYEETGDNDYSTLEGLVSTSKIITSAALIMIVVTGAFAFTEILPMQQMGIGVALAIFIDATIVRMVLVPSLMKMFGHWNWWLPFVKQKKAGERS